jgi:hypothetical protein
LPASALHPTCVAPLADRHVLPLCSLATLKPSLLGLCAGLVALDIALLALALTGFRRVTGGACL